MSLENLEIYRAARECRALYSCDKKNSSNVSLFGLAEKFLKQIKSQNKYLRVRDFFLVLLCSLTVVDTRTAA